MPVIPPFDAHGNLPPGIHPAPWDEVVGRFGTNVTRTGLLASLREALLRLAEAGRLAVWLDGSFVTAEEAPDDYDGAWETAGVDVRLLDTVFLGDDSPAKTSMAFRGSLFRVSAIDDPAWSVILEFFQWDRNGNRRGIIVVDPREVPR